MKISIEDPLLERPAAGFPLSSVALVVTVLGCLLASVDIDRWHKQYRWFAENGLWKLALLFGAASAFGAIVGLAYMFGGNSGWRSRKLAPFSGALAGGASVFVLLAPGALWRTILAVSILLTAVILLRLDSD